MGRMGKVADAYEITRLATCVRLTKAPPKLVTKESPKDRIAEET